MSASNFKIIKQCLMCGNLFESQKVTTKYCSHSCNSKHYKLRVRYNKRDEVEEAFFKTDKPLFKPIKNHILSIEEIRKKDFLSVKEVATLLNCNPKTVYKMIDTAILKAVKLTPRKLLIKRAQIDQLFE